MEYKGTDNLIGRRFNSLLVLDYCGNSTWECQCDCGNITKVKTSSLKSGKTKSCGCLRGQNTKGNTRKSKPKVDLTGQTFGYLTPLEYIKGGKWECLCKCGNKIIVDTRNLNSGHTRSCGCLSKEVNSKNNTLDMTGYETDTLKVLTRAGSDNGGIALWECLCKKCGRTFITRGSNIRQEYTTSCGCISSKNEEKIINLLQQNNIEFSTQYIFPDLFGINGGPLRFDFAIFKNHILSHLVEYNGAQHYIKTNTKWGENFETQQANDELKRKYCEKNNIPLVIIKYNEEYDINTLLNNL